MQTVSAFFLFAFSSGVCGQHAPPSPLVLTGGLLQASGEKPTNEKVSVAVGLDCVSLQTQEACVSPCSWDEFGCSLSEVQEEKDTAMILVVRSVKKQERPVKNQV